MPRVKRSDAPAFWTPKVSTDSCELQDGRPIVGEIAGVRLCQRCIDVALYLGKLEADRRERVAA